MFVGRNTENECRDEVVQDEQEKEDETVKNTISEVGLKGTLSKVGED